MIRFAGLILALLSAVQALAGPGDSVLLLYNSASPTSKDIAQHYAERRHVPENQILGLTLPISENISRADYRDKLELPLLKFLERSQLFTFNSSNRLIAAKIRYLTLCYDVPLRILEDPNLVEIQGTNLAPQLRRNGAAVDSELSLLPLHYEKLPLIGPLRNPLYQITNTAYINPINGVLIVARLDGPTPAIARALVDKALEAETNGLWGRAYFDLRGLTNGDYKLGDDWLRTAANAAKRYGFETVEDEKEPTFATNFPMSQIALYAGWYDGNVSGPFTRSTVEFMPGAIAYHLHSFSAATLRSITQNWCGPLLAKGVTATMGCVDEPLLQGTPDIGVFFTALLHSYTFGEAACVAQPVLSWQTTVIGDPLYQPFQNHPRELHEQLLGQKNKLVEWSVLRVVNLNLGLGRTPKEEIEYLSQEPNPTSSAVLTEKLGDLYQTDGQPKLARQSWQKALKLNPSPLQKIRLNQSLKK